MSFIQFFCVIKIIRSIRAPPNMGVARQQWQMAELISPSLISSLYNSGSPLCDVLLTVCSPQTAIDGLINTLPSHPMKTMINTITIQQTPTSFVAYTDHYRRIITLCKKRTSHDTCEMLIKQWRIFLSNIYTSKDVLHQLSPVIRMSVLFEIIKLVHICKDFDNPKPVIQSHYFTSIIQTIADNINDTLSIITETVIANCISKGQLIIIISILTKFITISYFHRHSFTS